MISTLYAQVAGGMHNAEWSIAGILIGVVVLAAVCALVFIALRQFGVTIPQWAMQVMWIVVIAFVVILAIKLVLSMW